MQYVRPTRSGFCQQDAKVQSQFLTLCLEKARILKINLIKVVLLDAIDSVGPLCPLSRDLPGTLTATS